MACLNILVKENTTRFGQIGGMAMQAVRQGTVRNRFHKKNERFTAILAGMVLLGVLIGALLYVFVRGTGDEETFARLALVNENFLNTRREASFLRILFGSFFSSTLYLGGIFLLGFWAISQPFTLLVLVFRGLGLGAVLAQIYAAHGRGAILITLVLILPYTLLSVTALVLGARESIRMSNIYCAVSLSSRCPERMVDTVKLYLVKFLVLEAMIAAAAAVDCICTVIYNRILG